MWIVFIARKALLSFYYFIVMRLFSGSLNSKIPHFYNGEIVLHYYSATWLHAREFVGKEFTGCYPQVTCLYREGQPNQQTTMISAREVDSDGYLIIWAYGGGYVSGHMLGVSVSICK